jgi:hypothetical protein
MPSPQDMITDIQRRIQDASYDDVIIDFLNQGLIEVASLFALPGLSVSDEIETDTEDCVVSMPDDYSTQLYHVTSASQQKAIKNVYNNISGMLRIYPNLDITVNGDITCCAVHGDSFYYYPVPEDGDLLTLWYYKAPTLMTVDDADGPDCIPENFHTGLLVNFACAEIFNEIYEGGVDANANQPAKVDSQMYRSRYTRFLTTLDRHLNRDEYTMRTRFRDRDLSHLLRAPMETPEMMSPQAGGGKK